MHLKDTVEREKRQCYYEIDDLCSNIKINMDNEEFRLKKEDKDKINNEIDRIYKWVKEKDYLERKVKELKMVIEKLQKRYGTLILRTSHGQDNVKSGSLNEIKDKGTSIFGNDDDEETVFEEVENDEFGFTTDMSKREKEELKAMREQLMDLCHSIYEILSTGTLLINEEHKEELKDHIGDILLWVHVKEKITKLDYQTKMDEINKACDDIMKKYNNEIFNENDIVKNIKTKRTELEQLCYALKSSIGSNLFSIEEDIIKELDGVIDEIFEWLIQIDIERQKAKLNNEHYNIGEEEYQEKIDKINNYCNRLYNSMVGINIYQEMSILDENIIVPEQIHNFGTTIDSLKTQD